MIFLLIKIGDINISLATFAHFFPIFILSLATLFLTYTILVFEIYIVAPNVHN